MYCETTELIYGYLRAYIGEWGYAPTVREIACACFCAPQTVTHHLRRLQIQGRIERKPNARRGITIVGRSEISADQRSSLPMSDLDNRYPRP